MGGLVVLAHPGGSHGDVLLKGNDVLLDILYAFFQIPDHAFLLVRVLQQFLDLYLHRLLTAFVLLDLGLGFGSAF